jgi:glycosyltransferase involved in cell wall biosynthesis
MSPRFAVDASSILNPTATGIGRYTRNLVVALDQVAAERDLPPVTLLYRSGLWRHRRLMPHGSHLRPQLWHKTLLPRAPRYAAVLCPEFRQPRWSKVARVGVIHDIHPVLGFNTTDEEQRQRNIAALREYVSKIHRLIFISQHAREEFLQHFEFPRERGDVIYHGVGPEFRLHSEDEIAALKKRYGLQRPYCLWTGSPRPSKNLDRLLQAFARSQAAGGCELLLGGHAGESERAAIERTVSNCGLGDRVRLLGYLPDDDIPPLFSAARAYLFPSLHEGFGMPILEAMASGTPVLTSNVTACPEAAGGHAVLVDPYAVDDIARGIDEVLQMSPERIAAARLYAASMSWLDTARKTLDALDRAAAGFASQREQA